MLPNPYTDGSYDRGASPASQDQGTLAQLQILAKSHPEILSDPAIVAAMSDPAKLQIALQGWQHSHGMDPNGVYDDAGTLQSRTWLDKNLPWIMALTGGAIATPAILGAFGGGSAAAGGGTLAELGPSTTANLAATGAAGAAPAGIAATGGGAAAAAGGAAASTPWWQTALKAAAPLAAEGITHAAGGGTATSPFDPTQQADIQSLLKLSLQRAQETAPIHQAAMALALHLAPTYARANGFPASPLTPPQTPTITNPGPSSPNGLNPATSAALEALIHGRSGGY